jgi:hypothetical protein
MLPNEQAEVKHISASGLCMDCVWDERCSFKQKSSLVNQCNEYDNHSGCQNERSRALGVVTETQEQKVCSDLKGLCSNCSQLSFCLYEKPTAGVWLCEEHALI